MDRKSSTMGLGRLLPAVRYSWQGLRAAWQHEMAFRQEVLVVAPLLMIAAIVPASPLEHAALMVTLLAVLLVELLNSALEATLDRVSEERHPLTGRAKDLGSAAVSMALLIALVTWGCVLGPTAWRHLHG